MGVEEEKKAEEVLGDAAEANDGKKKKKQGEEDEEDEEDELSVEDRALQEGLELAVIRVGDSDETICSNALQHLRKEIRSSTTSMTSVPKPLKFLRPHYETLKALHSTDSSKILSVDNRRDLADILSVLAMTMAAADTRESLGFKLVGNRSELGEWGHEFVRSLAGEIGVEYSTRVTAEDAAENPPDLSDLYQLVDGIVPFHFEHNAEAEAVDLLVEVQRLEKLRDPGLIDEQNYERVCLYLLCMSDFMADPDDLNEMLCVAFDLYMGQGKFPDALRVALRLDDPERVETVMTSCEDDLVKKQLGFILGRHRVKYECEDDDALAEIIGNAQLSEHFLSLARDLDVMETKTPEDIYKSHLAETGGFQRSRRENAQQVDSARANLASSFVNAFVNAGFGRDQLMTPEDSEWLYKNLTHGQMSAAASLGMILLWNVDEGLTRIDRFLYSSEEYIKAGGILAVGIVSSGLQDDCDSALGILSEYVEEKKSPLKCAALMGLGLAYAGIANESVMELLLPVIANTEDANMTEVSLAAMSVGMVYVGTCDEEVGCTIVQRLMECTDAELEHPMCRFLCLGLGLLFLGKTERADAMLEAIKTVEHKMGKYAAVTLESCAYAGTGNVLQIQKSLHMCAEHLDENAEHQSVAVLGIALTTLGESVGAEMALRTFDHLLQYAEQPIRRAVPLALALLHVSNPDYSIMDQMSRLTHDADADVAQSAIMGLGLMGAGTNNSRIAGLLRQLSEFYAREANHLFAVRIAQGLLHAGKGLMTMNPFHSDRLLMSGAAIAGILAFLHCCLDLKNTIFGTEHYLLFYLVSAMNPRMLVTLDEDMNPLPVDVRVGQAVETVGQAGRPKSITGFQTHTTPVLLGVTDRAELDGDEYIPLSSTLEGLVILRKNPDHKAPDDASGSGASK